MEALFLWLYIGLGVVIIIVKIIYRNTAEPDLLVYLSILSYLEWKSAKDIKIELEDVYNARILYSDVLHALNSLEEDGLVEHRNQIYRLNDKLVSIRQFRRSGRQRCGSDLIQGPTAQLA